MSSKSVSRGATRESDLLNLIGAIYDAALAPQDLPLVLSRLVRLCGGIWSPMSILPLKGGSAVNLQNTEVDPAHLALFASKYNRFDANPALPLLLATPPGRFLLREQHFSDTEWEHTDMYHEVYRPIGAYASLGAVLLKSEHHLVPLGILRPKSAGPFSSDDLALLDRALPHLKRMMQITLRLGQLEAKAEAQTSLWDRLPYGVVILDGDGLILLANACAEEILSRGDGLTTSGGALKATHADDNAALQKLIGEAAQAAIGRGTRSGGALALHRGPEPRRPLALLVAPFRIAYDAAHVLIRRPAVVAFVNDPECNLKVPAELLAELYRLTPREAALVSLLLEGLDLHEAADRLGVGLWTVRAHLQQVFDKTGTHRQAELVTLLLRSLAGLGGETHGLH